jgi:hypothetical protein
VNQHENYRVVMGGERLFNMTSHRTSGCLVNMLIACGGRSFEVGEPCSAYYENSDGESTRTIYYWSSADGESSRWPKFVRLTTRAAKLKSGLGRPQAVIDAKNAVLAMVQNSGFVVPRPGLPSVSVNFQQLDYVSQQLNGIGHADHWRRDADMRSVQRLSLPIAYSYPNSYLRQSGCPVSAQLHIRAITMEMSLIAHRLRVSGNVLIVIPHARFRIRAECVVTAVLTSPNPCKIARPWIGEGQEDVVTINNTVQGHFPEVSPTYEDIIFVDVLGRPSEPPVMVEWWGMLGSYSTPETGNVWAGRPSFGQPDLLCGHLRQALTGLTIPGWPYYDESKHSDPNQVYEGVMVLSYA